ncbi:MAG TPA: MXAN_5187 C-terminal domain-containing protein, partial [Anaeromyxobacteraceae bacterium]|nr:MXAN_5187 C-terminal domain-containing protein [Anaeromyxobacteraceae bacterium]
QPRTTQPLGPEDEEGAWRALLEEFLRVRTSCGESAEGITWERFRDKLRKNRDALVQKYACRTVRFQVYVKEGRAALRATPIR